MQKCPTESTLYDITFYRTPLSYIVKSIIPNIILHYHKFLKDLDKKREINIIKKVSETIFSWKDY